jgi:cytoskeletal protein RodZ
MVLLDVTHSEAAKNQVEIRKDETRAADHVGKANSPPPTTEKPDTDSGAAPSVGAQIQAARQSRGWDIDELVRLTSLSPRILRGMEADDFSASRGDCYARGHLRILARALSLDEAVLLAAVPATDPLAEPDDAVVEPPARSALPPLALLLVAVVLLTAVVAVLVR